MRVEIKELENLYKNAYNKNTNYFKLIRQYHWFYEVVECDPKTRKPLPQSLSNLLKKINDKNLYYKTLFEGNNNISYNARFIYICNYCKEEIKYIIKYINEFPKREHCNLYVSKVKELDINSFIKLNEKPGKNIRQKLADKPYMYAVKHIKSVDLLENRLFKSFVIQLLDILQIRKKILKDENDIYCLIPIIKKWLLTDESKSILNLEKLIPNNTLISNKHYKTIFDAWKELKEIDNNIKKDLKYVNENENNIKFWSILAQINLDKQNIKIADMPLVFNYDNKFSIYSYMQDDIYLRKGKEVVPIKIKINDFKSLKPFEQYIRTDNNIVVSKEQEKIKEPICLDLTTINPKWATSTKKGIFKKNFIWQSWKKDNEKEIAIALFNSNAVDDRTNHETIYLPDLFFSKKKDLSEKFCIDAGYSFTHKLQDYIDTINPFIWLVPDCLSFIDLELITKNINLAFSKADPLPRSVATLFTQKYEYFSKCKNKYIIVIDFVCDKISATKFRIEQVSDLTIEEKNILNNLTKGKILVREKTIELNFNDKHKYVSNFIEKFDDNKQWINVARQQYRLFKENEIKENEIKEKLNIHGNCDIIHITKEDVKDNLLTSGGIRLYELQKQSNKVALWRDNLPNLVTKIIVPNGYYDYVYFAKDLTSKYNTLGTKETFKSPYKLNIKKGENIFPLYLEYGETHNSTAYDAKLITDCDGECGLKIIYEYGRDFPYTVVFIQGDKEIIAHWKKREEGNNIDISNLPVPEFPPLDTWTKLENYPKKHDLGIENILQEVIKCFQTICQPNSFYYPDGRPDTRFIGKTNFYILAVWSAISLQDKDVPEYFKDSITTSLEKIEQKSNLHNDDAVILWLSAMHKDSPDFVREIIKKYIDKHEYTNETKLRCISYILGDCSETWQQNLLKNLLKDINDINIKDEKKIKIITILSFAVWYRINFINNSYLILKDYIYDILSIILKFDIEQVLNKSISQTDLGINKDDINKKSILDVIHNINPKASRNGEQRNIYKKLVNQEKWKYGVLFKLLELLYGLLRLRKVNDSELSQLFNPNNKVTKDLVDFVDKIIKTIVDNNKNFEIKIEPKIISRITIDIPNKREEFKNIPDLLYALRLYLTNDDGSSSISITEIQK